jgi:hypothetical protein
MPSEAYCLDPCNIEILFAPLSCQSFEEVRKAGLLSVIGYKSENTTLLVKLLKRDRLGLVQERDGKVVLRSSVIV